MCVNLTLALDVNNAAAHGLVRLQLHGAIYRPDSFVLMLRLLCEFENDKIWINKFEKNRSR